MYLCIKADGNMGTPLARLNSPTLGQVKFPQAGQSRL